MLSANYKTNEVVQKSIAASSSRVELERPEALHLQTEMLIQQQLALLIHAQKCQQGEQAETTNQKPCNFTNCGAMKVILDHMNDCKSSQTCEYQQCVVARQIISHWKNCEKDDCPVCKPLETFSKSKVPDSPFSTKLISSHSEFLKSLPSPDPPSREKEWHSLIGLDFRSHLISKIVKAIFPSSDPSAIHDTQIHDLVSYARKIEKEFFENANNKEEYYHLLAKKIYKIQKELQEKKCRQLYGHKASRLQLELFNSLPPIDPAPEEEMHWLIIQDLQAPN